MRELKLHDKEDPRLEELPEPAYLGLLLRVKVRAIRSRDLGKTDGNGMHCRKLFAHGASGPILKRYKKTIALTANKKISAGSTITHIMSLEDSKNAPSITEKALEVVLKP